jgi:hypothetical protein
VVPIVNKLVRGIGVGLIELSRNFQDHVLRYNYSRCQVTLYAFTEANFLHPVTCIVFLLMVYFTPPSVQDRMMCWQMSYEVERIWKEAVVV